MIDSHCHLNLKHFEDDFEAMLAHAITDGVRGFMNIGFDPESAAATVDLVERFPFIFGVVGCHPHDAQRLDDAFERRVREYLDHERIVGIGEIGLDYYRDRAPRDVQRAAFADQLELAAELELPVVVHTRNTSPDDRQALQDALESLAGWQASLAAGHSELAARPGVLHSYSGDLACAERAVGMNFFIGITGPVTFKNAFELREVISELPLECLLIETDAPFLTPHPHRGERNEPAHVRFVAEKIAEIHHQTFDSVVKLTSENAERLFRWRVTH